MFIPQPPRLADLRDGVRLRAGLGYSTVLADFDFETYSEAGFVWNENSQKYDSPPNAKQKGLSIVGAAAYSEHPSTEVLSMAYDLKDGRGRRLWKPGDLPPVDLFAHIAAGRLIEAWNCAFEYWIWRNVCQRKYHWPALPPHQLRDAMAKSRAFAMPGSLKDAGNVLQIGNKKDSDGERLLKKFSMPRNPTLNNPKRRILPQDDPIDAQRLYDYNLQDIAAEAEISSLLPDLNEFELEFWLCDQRINARGVQLDRAAIINCISIFEQAVAKYQTEFREITEGQVGSPSEIQKFRAWLMAYGISTPNLDESSVTELLSISSINGRPRRALEIRQILGSAAVKKIYSMLNQLTVNNRVHDLFVYHSARTGRAAGRAVQPQNLPNHGDEVSICLRCKRHFGKMLHTCPWCGAYSTRDHVEWNAAAMNDAFETIISGNLECLEYFWGNAVSTISGCLRGMFISAPGHDLICSDYSAIEAVVLAALAGEDWRLDVFKTHGKIYETSASKITGKTLQEYDDYRKQHGRHHPDRKIGKVAELASGYQGWIGAWKNFGADEFFSDDEMKTAILAWRAASPKIVEMWGGQVRDWYPDLYGLEGMAVAAIQQPGKEFSHRGITYFVHNDVLYCRLLSGRHIVYHKPRLSPSERKQDTFSISFEGWNSNPIYGKIGWTRMQTYGGKLTENVVQAIARDLLAHAIVNLEKAGYPVVLHVHDEIVAEVPEGFGSVEEFEKIMMKVPAWAQGWPIKASGGWRAKRYSK